MQYCEEHVITPEELKRALCVRVVQGVFTGLVGELLYREARSLISHFSHEKPLNVPLTASFQENP